MPGFQDIIGHEKIIRHMQQAICRDQVSHAYILDGPDLSGKKMLADAFAAALQCETQSGEACMSCRSCKQAANGNQPDIIRLQREKPGTISVKEIREQINGTMAIRPYSSRRKVYIVEDAQKMTEQAQNALLKTLEEPPEYAVILLLTTNSESFLPTIRSRCVSLRLQAVENAKIRSHLMNACRIPDYQTDICLAFAQGNVGRAIQLAGSEEFHERKACMLRHMKKAAEAKPHEIYQWIAELADWKDDITAYLELLYFWFRDVLLVKSGCKECLIFSDQMRELSRQADLYSYRQAGRILEEIHMTENRFRSNVNRELTLELLFASMQCDAEPNGRHS